METNHKTTPDIPPINLVEICRTLWKHRRLYYMVLPTTLVVTYLLTLCVPRYYTCEVELAPEGQSGLSGGSLASLASSFGIGNADMMNGEDAISALLYPDLLKSPNFIVTLFPIQVETSDGSVKTNYYDYMAHRQKQALWDKYLINPIIGLFKKPTPSKFKGTEHVDVKSLSKLQQTVVTNISGNVACAIDKKTNAISLTIKDQDPLVCATIGDSVMERIQSFIIKYRTQKARNDYEYFKRLRDEALLKYEQSRQKYANTSDANMDATLQSVQSKIADLENNMQLLYNNYSALAAQTQAAQAKIQERTPAFTPISTPVVPYKPAGPKRTFISLAMTILAAVVLSIVILIRNKKE